ncbi:MAG: response regulator transcription factor [Saprospiraceae bacterium]|nr:response regulator transcription factor [Saprospiraceae bacterium]
MNIVKIAIVDDHIIFRKGLRTILDEIGNVKVIAEASNGFEFFDVLKNNDIDVVLMDIKMPIMDGIEATKKAMTKYPNLKIIALTMHEEIGYFNKMIDAGAEGFLLKKTTKDELEKAIINVMEGDNYFSEEFISNVNRRNRSNQKECPVVLSEREMEVLEMICKGYSNNDISKELGISQRTVDGHRGRLFDKTGAKNAPNLVMYAIQHGLIKA